MRNFFYSKGDVLLAILIILVASVVIYVRIGVIMDYSASGESAGSLFPIEDLFGGKDKDSADGAGNGDDGAASDTSGDGGGDGDGYGGGESSGVSDSSGSGDGNDPLRDAGYTGPALDGSVQIFVVAGDTADVIADKLYRAGVIGDTGDFLYEVMERGAGSDFKIGTFTIPGGASVPEVIDIMTGWPD